MITDLQAKKYSSEWHGGQWTALYALSSSGAIASTLDCGYEITECLNQNTDSIEEIKLARLLKYILHYGPRDPVKGWSDLHW